MKTIDVCLTPELLHLHNIENSIVVVVDIFRATSCMTTAFANGVGSIIPVATIDECVAYQQQGYLAAAERDGKTPEGFDFDNSPFSYMVDKVKDATICVTTTNGTLAITKSKSAVKVMVGSFLNLGALATYLKDQQYDVLILCAGWKGKPNLEDTLFAGALVERLKEEFMIEEDSALMALRQYQNAKDDLLSYVASSSHVRRLQRLGIQKDIAYCLQHDLYDVLPVLRGNALVNM
ncbi:MULTISPECIES: 2-phosphosulfolactate phosphatase [Flectobacillus]|uniref:Probable 2-phosphosulfolactate phosphatase n=2 Tax=Flectobacillus TaxID=101 RepID=A0ABT6Z026_9BACT|nr:MULTISPECIES: 2-phosphosulfolactate phosphatase [Flectobacillus]MDI9867356.1 2-phosphosulfolactate phosphatase [Flectobacillus longus]MDI9874476.1 2-phosphosulfolactate phosphatase [Flectobacillus rivi]